MEETKSGFYRCLGNRPATKSHNFRKISSRLSKTTHLETKEPLGLREEFQVQKYSNAFQNQSRKFLQSYWDNYL